MLEFSPAFTHEIIHSTITGIFLGIFMAMLVIKHKDELEKSVRGFALNSASAIGDVSKAMFDMYKVTDDISSNCMRKDRFEFVDVKKLDEERDGAKVNA